MANTKFVEFDDFAGSGMTEQDEYIKMFELPDDVQWFLPKEIFGEPSVSGTDKPSARVTVRFVSWVIEEGKNKGKLASFASYLMHSIPYGSKLNLIPKLWLCGKMFGQPCEACEAKFNADRQRKDYALKLKHRDRMLMLAYVNHDGKDLGLRLFDFVTYSKTGQTAKDLLRNLANESNPALRIEPRKFAAYGDGAKWMQLSYSYFGATKKFRSWNLVGMSPLPDDATLSDEAVEYVSSLDPLKWMNPKSVNAVPAQALVDDFEGKTPAIDLETADFVELAAFVVQYNKDNPNGKLADVNVKLYSIDNPEELRETIKTLLG